MSNVMKLIIFCLGFSLCTWVMLLLARKKINERNTIVWIGGVLIIVVLSVNPAWIDVVARWAGVSYPPSLFFLFSVIVVFVMTLYQSIQISQMNARIKELSQAIALQNERIETKKGSLFSNNRSNEE